MSETVVPENAPGRRRYNRLSKAQWAEVERLRHEEGLTLNALAERFGVHYRTMQFHFAKQKKQAKGALSLAELERRMMEMAFQAVDKPELIGPAQKFAAFVTTVALAAKTIRQADPGAGAGVEA